jgi:hypothetical protein
MRSIVLTVFIACLAAQSFAMKNRHETFSQPCDVVWKASMIVAKSEQYRVVSVSKEEQIISLAAGGAWWGERIISLNLAPGAEQGCIATVQSRYSGLEHSDGPDLLARIHVELIGEELGFDSEPFQKFKRCMEDSHAHIVGDEPKCEAKLRRRLDDAPSKSALHPDAPLWNITKP